MISLPLKLNQFCFEAFSVRANEGFFEKNEKKVRAYYFVDSKSANKTVPA